MACFLVPAAGAAVTKVVSGTMKTKEEHSESVATIPFSRKLGWLTKMLTGGSALLAFEHLWHGEITPFFPFLTAASDAASASEMLHEMSTVGVSMAALVTVVWLGMVAVTSVFEKAEQRESEKSALAVQQSGEDSEAVR